MKNNKIHLVALGAAALAMLAACSHPSEPSEQALTAAMTTYLAKRGDLCLGKDKWPIDVPAREVGTRARNAVQMPVLEHAGLVSATTANVEASGETPATSVTRYMLSDEGRKYFVAHEAPGQGAHPDFCAARLTLDKIVGWEAKKDQKDGKDASEVVVSYTYKVDAAPWTRDADVQKAFPMVDRVVRGAGTMQLKQSFRHTESGWVAAGL
jgi:hypothetical protein